MRGHKPSAECQMFGPRNVTASWALIGIFIAVTSLLAGLVRKIAQTWELVRGCGLWWPQGTLFLNLRPPLPSKQGVSMGGEGRRGRMSVVGVPFLVFEGGWVKWGEGNRPHGVPQRRVPPESQQGGPDSS